MRGDREATSGEPLCRGREADALEAPAVQPGRRPGRPQRPPPSVGAVTEPPVYRAPMRSRLPAIPPGAGVERALAEGVVGLGGTLDPAPAGVREAAALAAEQHDERLAARIERFADAPDGAFVWTLDADGLSWLGRLAGPWRYDASPDAAAADLVHVRPCAWLGAPVADTDVPPAVRATFARGGLNWQRTHDDAVSRLSAERWERGVG